MISTPTTQIFAHHTLHNNSNSSWNKLSFSNATQNSPSRLLMVFLSGTSLRWPRPMRPLTSLVPPFIPTLFGPTSPKNCASGVSPAPSRAKSWREKLGPSALRPFKLPRRKALLVNLISIGSAVTSRIRAHSAPRSMMRLTRKTIPLVGERQPMLRTLYVSSHSHSSSLSLSSLIPSLILSCSTRYDTVIPSPIMYLH